MAFFADITSEFPTNIVDRDVFVGPLFGLIEVSTGAKTIRSSCSPSDWATIWVLTVLIP